MIFIDANYFIQVIVATSTPEQRSMTEAAITLFRQIAAGEEQATTSDAVLAEVAFILSSKRHYNLSAKNVADRLKPLLYLHELHLPQKRICLRALDLWVTYPRIGFVDALGASYAELQHMSLATFDVELSRVSGVTHWHPPELN